MKTHNIFLSLLFLVQCAKPDIHDPTTSTNEANFSSAVIVPLLKRAGILIPSFLIGTFALKYLFSKLLQVDDDVSIHSNHINNVYFHEILSTLYTNIGGKTVLIFVVKTIND